MGLYGFDLRSFENSLPDQVEITNLRGKGYQLVLNQRDLGDE